MTERPYESVTTPQGPVLRVRARGFSAAVADDRADVALDDPIQQVHQAMWRPEYPRVDAG